MFFGLEKCTTVRAWRYILSSYSFKDRKRLFNHELKFPTMNPIKYLNRFQHKQGRIHGIRRS